MIIQYTNHKIVLDANELAKAAVLISTNAAILFIGKTAYTSLAASSENFYKSECTFPSESIECFTHYTRMQSSNILNSSIDKVGGVFAMTCMLFLLKEAVTMGSRAITRYKIPSQPQL